jgi:signal transduction histidine kinase
MRSAGLWLGDPLMIAVVIAAVGIGVVGGPGRQVDGRSSAVGSPAASSLQAAAARIPQMTDGRLARWRLVGGAALVAVGLVVVGTQHGVSGRVRFGAVATACTIIGVALVFGPWIARSAQEVAEERRRRIRSDERAEVAAHLHDSVLQTLALIQRNANDPRRTVTLARRQERELRAWLFGDTGSATSLAAALREMAEDVEVRHDVAIDVVVVGDRPMDDAGTTILGAAREACVNAAEHSGTLEVSVFAEVRADAVEVFVRDRGRGFVRTAVAADRHGITDSIEARVRRAGGAVEIESEPGSGTEVHLVMPFPDVTDEAST